MDLVSSGEGNRFAEIMNDFGDHPATGPLGSSEGVDRANRPELDKLAHLVPYIKRVKLDKLKTRLQAEEEYHDLFTREEIEELLRDVVSYYIDPEKCQACRTCAKRCPVDASTGART